jgi:hypothetical protein
MTFGHERQRERVSLLAAGALAGRERQTTLAHVDSCAECRQELDRLREALDLLAGDPVREADPPIPFGALVARVEARLAEEAQHSGWRAPWISGPRWALLPLGAGGTEAPAAVALAVLLLPPPPVSAPGPPPAIAVSDEALDRLERNVSREQTARYLNDAGDVLRSVAAAPEDCDRRKERVDVGQASARSRELLARRALLLESGAQAVASVRPVLDDVEQALREVASLESCVRRRDIERVRDDVERSRLLMRIRLMTRELEG